MRLRIFDESCPPNTRRLPLFDPRTYPPLKATSSGDEVFNHLVRPVYANTSVSADINEALIQTSILCD